MRGKNNGERDIRSGRALFARRETEGTKVCRGKASFSRLKRSSTGERRRRTPTEGSVLAAALKEKEASEKGRGKVLPLETF